MKYSIYIIIGISILFISCAEITEKDDYRDLVEEIEINPEHEYSPPIATNIFLEELDQPEKNRNNIKLIAEFESGIIRGNYLSLLLNDEKIVLRDDGQGADKVKGDNRFSINLKENLDEIKSELSQRQRLGISNERQFSVKNRALSAIDKENLRGFNVKQIRKGKATLIPIDIIRGIRGLSDQKKTLMITELNVVEDPSRTFNPCTLSGNPNGVWTFGEIIRQMASQDPSSLATDLEASNFVRNWLNTWTTDKTINGEILSARSSIQSFISDWEIKSAVSPGGILDLKFAPFKLIAIVNRLDLRGNSGYGFSNAGEGRFVFNALSPTCNPMQFTIIFEYGINKRTCSSVKTFAQEWNNLNSLAIGTPAYNSALESITNQFLLSGTSPSKPNQNSINQIRTNEIALSSPWELREFNLNTAGQLELTTVKQEPAVKYNAKISNAEVERLVAFINANQSDIENNDYTVTADVPFSSTTATPAQKFLGGKSETSFPPTGTPPSAHHWNGTNSVGSTFIISDEARHVFSLNTCSGCHGGETQTFFTHISPSNFGTEASLSGFLTGINVIDAANRPNNNPTQRNFNDLLRREIDLASLISNNCLSSPFIELAHNLTFEPLRMTH